MRSHLHLDPTWCKTLDHRVYLKDRLSVNFPSGPSSCPSFATMFLTLVLGHLSLYAMVNGVSSESGRAYLCQLFSMIYSNHSQLHRRST